MAVSHKSRPSIDYTDSLLMFRSLPIILLRSFGSIFGISKTTEYVSNFQTCCWRPTGCLQRFATDLHRFCQPSLPSAPRRGATKCRWFDYLLPIRFKGLHSKRESAPGLSLDAMIQSVNLSSPWELLCYFIYPLGIERNMPPNLHNSRKRILV